MLFPGSYNGRFEEFRSTWDAGIQTNEADSPILIDNVVAGSQRSGFWVDGEECDTGSNWRGNVAHSTLIGVMLLPDDGILPCTQLTNFVVYRNWDFGVYFQTESSVRVVNLLAIDNKMAVFPIVLKPRSLSHEFENKYVEILESTIVGRSSSFMCDSKPLDNGNYNLSDAGRSWTSPDGGVIGISFASFLSHDNRAPYKPFTKSMSYNSIRGHMTIKGKLV